MVDSSKFAKFIEKAKQNIEQIKIGLLRHDKNPQDREFLNDISKSVSSIKNAAAPLSLPRTIELCHNLEILINLIKEERKELHQEIIITIAACRDRLAKFVFELETVQMERAKVKDLVTLIQKQIDNYNTPETSDTNPALSATDSAQKQATAPGKKERPSLLPEEIINKDYDKELFEIFLEQLQENLSLLRTLTDSFDSALNKDKVMNQCSTLVGKLQSSANYMDYEQLADFHLQWIAELEMAGVDLSMGTTVSFDFMDHNIKKVADLFPEIEDKPADQAALEKAARNSTPSPSPAAPEATIENIVSANEVEQMFTAMDTSNDDELDDDMEPVAALAGVTSFDEEEAAAAENSRSSSPRKKESRGKKVIEIDGSFLEEEKESENYDDELFQIFVQQLQENISQLQQLTDSFISEPNKSNITDKCSNLVGKLQASANYMGYERLAEFYLQWIAELEMIGVELSIGSDISFDFMQEKIDRIISLFPEAGSSLSAQSDKQENQKSSSPELTAPGTIATAKKFTPPVEDDSNAHVFDDLEEEEEIEDPLPDGIDPIAGVFDDYREDEPGNIASTAEGGEFSEAVDEKLESFFADMEEPDENEEMEKSFMAIASLSDEVDDSPVAMATDETPSPADGTDELFDEQESVAEEFESIAGISDYEETLPEENVSTKAGEFKDALNEKLENFFGDLNEQALDEELDTAFMDIASLNDEDDNGPVTLTEEELSSTGGIDDLFDEESIITSKTEVSADALFENEPIAQSADSEGNDFSDAVDEKLESFFTDFDEPEEGEELETSFMEIASISEEETEEQPIAFTAEPPVAGSEENLFDDEEEEEPLGEGIESIAGLYDEEGGETDIPSASLLDETKTAINKSEGVEFIESMDDKLDNFFADMDDTENGDDFDTALMEIVSDIDETEEVPSADAEETEPITPISEEELADTEDVAAALFEEESESPLEESEEGEFIEAMDETLDTFFSDLDEEETQAAETEPIIDFSSDRTAKIEIDEDSIFDDETFPGTDAEPAEAAFSYPITEDIDAFFGTDEDEEETPDQIITEESITEIATSEEIIETSEVSEEVTGDIDALMSEEELHEKEITVEVTPDAEDETEEKETVISWSDEMLTDEELLQEIEGPIVGEDIADATESLLPEIKITEAAVSVLSTDELTEEELFKKLEGAITVDKDETSDIDVLHVDDETFDEFDATEEVIETAPERKELFKKLSSALLSLDDEPGDLETVEETTTEIPVPEFDNHLFNRLASALETPSEPSGIAGIRPMDLVLEEILSGIPVKTGHTEPPGNSIPKKLAASEIKQIIRMDTDKVDRLMNQVRELNANRSTLKQLFAEMNDLHRHYLEMDGFNKQELKPFKDLLFRLGDTSVSLNRLSSEIREGILNVRMVPIGLLFNRYHEFVKDLTSNTDKQVEIEITGEDTELEKIVIDEISEPLTHLISNTVEHAIENVDERKRLGKTEIAKIKLEAYHENNEIVIEVIDDGRGIDLKKVKAKALEQGLFTADELFKMPDSDLKRLILNPKFSTVDDKGRKPEDRGEGLHIVQTNLERLKGSIDIRSKEGQGTIIQIRVPLNLLVIKALKVKAGEEIMALPVNCIEEILKVRTDVLLEKDGNTVITIHDTTVPVFKLTELFNIEPVAGQGERVYIILVKTENKSIGLIVDETSGLEEIIIKPLGKFLRKESGFAGATIISDGNISLIPDITELIRIATNRRPVPEESAA